MSEPMLDDVADVTVARNIIFEDNARDLLRDVAVSRNPVLDAVLRQIKTHLESMPEQELTTQTNQARCGVPLRRSQPLVFRTLPPAAVDVIGSYALGCDIDMGNRRNVDVAVEISADMLFQREFLKFRYLEKRAAWLHALAQHLSQSDASDAEWQISLTHPFGGSEWKPCLVVTPTETVWTACASAVQQKLGWSDKKTRRRTKQAKATTIRVLPVLPLNAFVGGKQRQQQRVLDLSRLAFDQDTLGGDKDDKAGQTLRTRNVSTRAKRVEKQDASVHNTLVLQDVLALPLHQFLADALLPEEDNPADSTPNVLLQCVQVLKVWLRRRELDGLDGMTGTMLACVVAFLRARSLLLPHMSLLQCVRMTMETLASERHWGTKGLHLGGDSPAHKAHAQRHAESLKLHAPTLLCSVDFDLDGNKTCLNLAAHMSNARYELLRQAARAAYDTLRASDTLSPAQVSELLFDESVDLASQCDELLRVCPRGFESFVPPVPAEAHQAFVQRRVCTLLTRALGTRATVVATRSVPVPRVVPITDRSLCEGEFLHAASVQVALQLDALSLRQLQDFGPPPHKDNESEVRKWRAFWGPRTRLCRQSDGTLRHVVSWNDVAQQQGTVAVPAAICRHILSRHLQLDASRMTALLSSVLHSNNEDKKSEKEDVLCAATDAALLPRFSPIKQAFNALKDELRTECGGALPLRVVDVSLCDSALAEASVCPPLPLRQVDQVDQSRRTASLVPLPVAVTFESAGGWPEDVGAVGRLKTALLVRMAEAMRRRQRWPATPALQWCDILVDGVPFRVQMLAPQELLLLRVTENPTFEDMERRMRYWPLHSNAVSGLSGASPTMAAALRLVKRWLASQLMLLRNDELDVSVLPEKKRLPGFSEAAAELMVMSLWTSPAPFRAPPVSSVQALRRFWRLLCEHDWLHEPLLVSLDARTGTDMTFGTKTHLQMRQDVDENFTKFAQKEGRVPFIATPKDLTSVWTSTCPSLPALERVQTLARRHLAHVDALLQAHLDAENSDLDAKSRKKQVRQWQALFECDTSRFDLVLVLRDDGAVPYSDCRLHMRAARREKTAKRHLLPPKDVERPDTDKDGFKLAPSKALAKKKRKIQTPTMGYDPLWLVLRDLRASFGNCCTLCVDRFGVATVGNGAAFIGVSVDPSVRQRVSPVPFEYSMPKRTKTSKKGKKSKGNKKTADDTQAPQFVFNVRQLAAEMLAVADGLAVDVVFNDAED
ncbi:MAG: hypothetical protein MHM6MM_001366 [Cercozoa sp. M6MM]